jgi:hypothetical protein
MSVLAQPEKVEITELRAVGRGIVQCWVPPASEVGRPIDVTVKLSFSRTGAVIGTPHVTFVGGKQSPEARQKIKDSIFEAVRQCTPLNFNPSLGAAIAGRMFMIRFFSSDGRSYDT